MSAISAPPEGLHVMFARTLGPLTDGQCAGKAYSTSILPWSYINDAAELVHVRQCRTMSASSQVLATGAFTANIRQIYCDNLKNITKCCELCLTADLLLDEKGATYA